MIQLNPDCLIFQTSSGENIPCSAELVTIELIGDSAKHLDPEIIRNASAAVLHYFKNELGRTFVTVAEFSVALERVLKGFGLSVADSTEPVRSSKTIAEADLRQVASTCGKGFELIFYAALRDEVRRGLKNSPEILWFKGLRGCVKDLTGAQRWCRRCEAMSDQIVDFLRGCLSQESKGGDSCALIVL